MRSVIVVEIFARHGHYKTDVHRGLSLRHVTEPRAVASGLKTQLAQPCEYQANQLTLSLYPARYRSRFCNGASRSITVITNLCQMTTRAVAAVFRGFLSSGEEQYFHCNCGQNLPTDYNLNEDS